MRWYSPRDWVPPLVDQASGRVIEEGHLSHRMQLPGNTWQEVWETARPTPAHRQKRLFDDTKEAEKVRAPGWALYYSNDTVLCCTLASSGFFQGLVSPGWCFSGEERTLHQ